MTICPGIIAIIGGNIVSTIGDYRWTNNMDYMQGYNDAIIFGAIISVIDITIMQITYDHISSNSTN